MSARRFTCWLLPALAAGCLLGGPQALAGAETKSKAAAKSDKTLDAKTLANNAATTGKIKSALLADKVAPGMSINVDTNAGVVTLSGEVASQAQKQRAEAIAKKTEGVKKVVNKLTIKKATSTSGGKK